MHYTIKKYVENNNEEYQRYNSWNHCYKAFEGLNKDDISIMLRTSNEYSSTWEKQQL